MPFNGSGAYSAPAASFPAFVSTLIESAKFNSVINDIASALSTCITKDGQTTVTANIPFGGNKLTGVGAATSRTDAATLASIQDGTGIHVGTVGGTADAITLTPSPAITAYATGQRFSFIASGANTGAVTVAISGLVAKSVTRNGTTALIANQIPSGALVQIIYDGTRFQLQSVAPLPLTTSDYADDSVTYAKIQNVTTTDRVLGRSSAGAGDIEEIVCTLFARTFLDDANAQNVRNTLGSGTTGDALFLSATAAAARSTLGINTSGLHLLIGETTATSIPQLDIDMSGYTAYRTKVLVIHHANPASAFPFSARISTDGGASFISTNTYGNVGNAIVDRVTLTGDVNVGTDSANGLSATIELWDTINTVHKKIFHFETGFQDSTGAIKFANNGSHETGISAYNAIRLFFDSGNIDTITYSLYGRSNGP